MDSRSAPSQAPGLSLWLAFLCGLALLAAARALLLPPWPRAMPLQAAALSDALRRHAGAAVPLAPVPPQRNADRDLAAGLRWRLADGDTLQLHAVAVRSWPDWQVAAFTTGVPALALRDRRFSPAWPGVALGQLQGRLVLQTCLVPQPSGPALPGVTREALTAALQRVPPTRSQRLAALLGLRPAYRLNCTLLTLRAGDARAEPPAAWRGVIQLVATQLAVPSP